MCQLTLNFNFLQDMTAYFFSKIVQWTQQKKGSILGNYKICIQIHNLKYSVASKTQMIGKKKCQFLCTIFSIIQTTL